MSANLCTESHMREFMEQGFEVLVITDAVAAGGQDCRLQDEDPVMPRF